MLRFAPFALLAVLSAAGGCSQPTLGGPELIGHSEDAPPAPVVDPVVGRLTITGSSTVAPLMAEIAKRFEQSHPRARVDVQSGGSSRGIADVRRGIADIGMVSRDLKPDEADLVAHPIARDGICMIVHADNPVAELSNGQIVAMYTGKVDDWANVGGLPGPITVVHKAQGRSTLELFLHHFSLDADAIEADVVIGDNQQGIKTVAGNPGAIGYVSIGAAEYEAAHTGGIRLLPLGGVAPTTANVQRGAFPLARMLNIVTGPNPSPLATSLIDFAQSDEVQDLVDSQYFVRLSGAP